MIAFFLLLMSASAHAKGEKILYSWGSGQGVIVVGDKSEGADATVKGYEVIWDERKDGAMPDGVDPITASRSGKRLVLDPKKQAAKRVEETARAAKAAQEASDKLAFKELKEKLLNESATPEEVRKVVKAILLKIPE